MPGLTELTAATPQPTGQMTATPQAPARPMTAQTDDVFSFILKGLKDNPTNGNRNNFIHLFASECNRFGISENNCFRHCLQWKEKDFTSNEIQQTIKSAYRRTAEHGTKEYKPMEHHRAAVTRPQAPERPTRAAEDYSNMMLKYELDYSHPPDRPPTAIKINGEIVSTLGNFCAVIGKAKSRKSFFLTSIAAAALKGECLNVTSELPENKRTVLLFDTEQSGYHVFKTFDRIKQQSGITANLRIFQLREVATADRVQVIETALNEIQNVGLVIIDGLRDLISDINSQEQATMINDRLLRWTSKYQISIFVVIHQNKNDSNARGHIGSEVVNKSETTISIEKDTRNPDFSIVKPEYCRNMDFEAFGFSINDDGLPMITDFVNDNTTGKKGLLPKHIDDATHLLILKSVFSKSKELKYSEVQTNVIDEFKRYGHSLGKNKSREFINYYDERKLLSTSGYPGTKYFTYKLSDELPF